MNRIWILVVPTVIFALIALWFSSRPDDSSMETPPQNPDLSTPVIDTSRDPSRELAAPQSNGDLSSQPSDAWLDANQILALNDWMQRNGFARKFAPDGYLYMLKGHQNSELSKAEPSSYEVYDTETLRAFAESSGEAALVLGLRLNHEGQEGKAVPYLREAAAHGYARAPIELRGLYLRKAKNLLRDAKISAAEDMYVEGLAWQHTLYLRYLPDSAEPKLKHFAARYGLEDIDGDRLSEIVERASLRGAEVFQQLQQRRYALGFSEFTNDLPESVRGLASATTP